MVTLLVSNPLVPQLDLSCLRVVSAGGSPLPPAMVKRAIATFGCQFFVSYGMTECCGKISMSILPEDCRHLRHVTSPAVSAVCSINKLTFASISHQDSVIYGMQDSCSRSVLHEHSSCLVSNKQILLVWNANLAV